MRDMLFMHRICHVCHIFKMKKNDDEIRDLMFTEIGWTIPYYPMLTMLTWMRPAYFYFMFYTSLSIYIYIYTHTHMYYVYIYIYTVYIYIYIYVLQNRDMFYKTVIPDTGVLVPPTNARTRPDAP